jgi:acetyltransferase-like isoleucine patch superfamily enzyme
VRRSPFARRLWAEWNLFPLRWGLRSCGPDVLVRRPHLIKGASKISIGRGTQIGHHVSIQCWPGPQGWISLGENCDIGEFAMILSYGGDIVIGSHCSVNPFSILYGHGGLKIGDHVRIAGHTVIIPAEHRFEDPNIPIAHQGATKKGIVIEDDVWIGTHCSILDGVTVGRGAVIGAGSVVTRDVSPFSVVAGVPAQRIRTRNTEPSAVREGLQNTEPV